MKLRPDNHLRTSENCATRLPAALFAAAVLGLGLSCSLPAAAAAAPSAKNSAHSPSTASAPASAAAGVLQVAPAAVGVSKSVTLSDTALNGDIVLPAIPGVTWTSVTAKIQWPTQMTSGTLAVGNTTRTFQTITASPDIAKLQDASLDVEQAVSGQQYQINLSAALQYHKTYAPCGTVNNLFLDTQEYAPTIYIESVGYRITGTNQTVGGYLQGPIQNLILRLPMNAGARTKQALLALESELVSNDANTSVNVEVLPTSAPIPAHNHFTRVVTFSGGDSPTGAIAVGPDGLQISGDGAAAERQVDLLEQTYASLIQSSKASVLRSDGSTREFPNTMSFQQLGVNDLTTSGWGDFGLGLSFTEAATGGEVQGATYSIRGTNSGIARGAGATITLLDNGSPIQGTQLSTSQPWSLNGTIPSTSIGRSIGLSLQVQYFGSVGQCAELPPLTVAVSPTSGFTFTHGVSAETGFQDLPQMLMPTVDVVLSEPHSFTQFQNAAEILAGAQRLTPVTLGVLYSGSSTLPSGDEPAIVVAGSHSPLNRELKPAALNSSSVQFTHADQTTEVRVGGSYALLTAGRRVNGAPVLALLYPSAKPQLAGSLLNALGGSEQRWYGLTGDTAVLGANGQIATAQVGITSAITVAQVAHSWLSHRWVWAFLGAAAVLLVLLAMGVGRRLRYGTLGGSDRRSAQRRQGERRRDDPPESD